MLRTAGFDIARSSDYAALTVVAITQDKVATIELNHTWPRSKSHDTPYYSILINGSNISNIPGVLQLYRQYHWSRMGVDATGFGDSMPEALRAKGIPNTAVNFSNKWKNDGMMLLKILVHEKRIRIPKEMSDLKTQMLEQQEIFGAPGTTSAKKFAHPANRHDDLLWSMILALDQARQVLLRGHAAIAVGTMGGGQELQTQLLTADDTIMRMYALNGINDKNIGIYTKFLIDSCHIQVETAMHPGYANSLLVQALREWEKIHRNEL